MCLCQSEALNRLQPSPSLAGKCITCNNSLFIGRTCEKITKLRSRWGDFLLLRSLPVVTQGPVRQDPYYIECGYPGGGKAAVTPAGSLPRCAALILTLPHLGPLANSPFILLPVPLPAWKSYGAQSRTPLSPPGLLANPPLQAACSYQWNASSGIALLLPSDGPPTNVPLVFPPCRSL